jgi:endonuclease YncB( thermonuclease family)
MVRTFFLLVLPLIVLTSFRVPDAASGRVVKVVDGDTYDIVLDGVQSRIRMDAIDAPERGQDFGTAAKNYLGELCDGQTIRLNIKSRDRFGRIIAQSFLPDGRELGAEMIRAGMAWHYTKYSSDPRLSKLEAQARAARRGLWSMPNPTPPWDYRKMKRG